MKAKIPCCIDESAYDPRKVVAGDCKPGATMENQALSDLIEKAMGGNKEAIGILFEQYRERLKRILLARGLDENDVEDILQDVSMILLKNFSFDPSRVNPIASNDTNGVLPWLCTIVHNERKRFLRKRANKKEVPLQPEESGCLKAAGFITDLSEEREQLYLRWMAYQQLLRLLFLCGGYPHEQLAFGYIKVLFGKPSNRAIEGNPQQVEEKYGNKEIRQLIDLFQKKFHKKTAIDEPGFKKYLEHVLCPIRQRSELKVGVLIQPLEDHLKPIEGTVVKLTCLNQYYENTTKTHPFTYWCARVSSNLRKVFDLPENTTPDEVIDIIAEKCRDGPVEPHCPRLCKLRNFCQYKPGHH
ncbi:MAG: RNA polymerase sigma factor [Planctomycetota bacterium]|jgi:DNA-directed RNA polymerase specialized sigma24 family protein